MSYVGSAPSPSQVQFSTLDAQAFNGDGSTTAFTLNRAVSIAASIEVTVNNVQQSPYDGSYTVNGTTTLTFSEAPSSGTDNIYVRFLDYPLASITPGAGTVGLTQFSATGTPSSSTYLRGDNSWAAIASSQWTTTGSDIYYNTGSVGIGTSSPAQKLDVSGQIKVNNGGDGFYINPNASDTRLVTSGTLPLTFRPNDTERMRIDSSGNVGIGTSSPGVKLDVNGGDFRIQQSASTARQRFVAGSNQWNVETSNSTNGYAIYDAAAGQLRTFIDTSGNFQFNSGYGSVATAYGCRAWVNFNGTGTVAIRASGNVSSITDNGTGNYSMNFSNAMPDINYCPTYYLSYYFNLISGTSNRTMGLNTRTTSAFTFQTTWTSSTSGGASVEDLPDINVAILR